MVSNDRLVIISTQNLNLSMVDKVHLIGDVISLEYRISQHADLWMQVFQKYQNEARFRELKKVNTLNKL